MLSEKGSSTLTGNISYASPLASRGKDFDLGEEGLTKTTEDENVPFSSSFVGWQLPPLHDAAERGDDVAVSKLLLSGNVDVNEKAGGHRALRTALHRAAGYGHLGVVKQLIKAGADPDKHSSARRTPLHEACTGGHKQVVKELLNHIVDVDTVDCNSQTAAHLAAYHGEVDCLKELISSGCNVALEDKQARTPAHLAAMKNHPALLRCLVENDTELNCGDDQGLTPAHFAAISGGLESLKVLAQSDVDLNSRDAAGCMPGHYAAAYDHRPCLMFLVNTGVTKMDVRDKSGRSLLHLAAQHGATECLHWLLERKGNPNIIDGSGATPVHYAALGAHLQCINCLIQHGADVEVQTASGDAPVDFAKRAGNPNSFQRAVNGEVPCRFCVSKRRQYEYDLAHQPTSVEKNIIQQGSQIYLSKDNSTDSAPRIQQSHSSHSAKRPGTKSKGAPQVLPKRDLASRYFGEHLFTLPVGVTGSKTASSSSRGHRKR